MADEAPTTRRPNKTLSLILLVLAAVGTTALMISAFLAFFQEDRETGMWHFSFGLLWFLFFTWAARAAMRPFPAP